MKLETYLYEAWLSSDGLVKDSFVIMKEENNRYWVGFPYNKRFYGLTSLKSFFNARGKVFSEEALISLLNMSVGELLSFSLKEEVLQTLRINYIYSNLGG